MDIRGQTRAPSFWKSRALGKRILLSLRLNYKFSNCTSSGNCRPESYVTSRFGFLKRSIIPVIFQYFFTAPPRRINDGVANRNWPFWPTLNGNETIFAKASFSFSARFASTIAPIYHRNLTFCTFLSNYWTQLIVSPCVICQRLFSIHALAHFEYFSTCALTRLELNLVSVIT